MKKSITKALLVSLIAVLSLGMLTFNTYAEEEGENTEENSGVPNTSLTITPVHQTLQISSNSSYDGTIKVTNDGSEEMKVQVYASPYSYIYSEEDDIYKLGFSNENNFTQISRWITIKDNDGNYTKNPTFTIPAEKSLDIKYKVDTPNNIPAGGQYAVIFVQTISNNTNASGIRTEASAGMIVYGHSTEGEAVIKTEISDVKIERGLKTANPDGSTASSDNFYGFAKVKNTGNIDFYAKGVLKAEPIIGFSSYETENGGVSVSIIPESERVVTDEWEDMPGFGLYKITWTVTAGENTETSERVVFLFSPVILIISIIVLTIVVMLIIIRVRKRRERRSRLAV